MSDENKVQIEWVQCCVAHKPRNIARQTPVQWAVDPVLFGKRYHEERTKRRLSHEQVRKKVMDMIGEDVSVSYLQEIEQGKCNGREWCHYLAKIFDVCPEYFAGVVAFRWITREKAHNSVYPEKQTEEGLFKVLYEVASDSNSRAQFQTIMMRNYQYKEWND